MKTQLQNYKATIQYDGSDFYGFQVQRKQEYPTVQKVLEDVCRDIFKRDTRILASGRTDRGVHARAQVINFKAPPIMPVDNLKRVLNVRLPDSVRVDLLEKVDKSFHSIHSAQKKTYMYFIDMSENTDIFQREYVWQLAKKLDHKAMQDAANILIGEHDFSAFAQIASSYKTCVRKIFDFDVNKTKNQICISVTGSGFLRGMVRNLVALLVLVGLNKIDLKEVERILQEKDRGAIGPSAPACGLYLWQVYY